MLHGAEKGGGLRLPPLQSIISYTPGDALGAATFTRASAANYIDVNGVVQTAASGVPRDGHYVGATRGYLSEPAATNICKYGSDFTNVAWTTASGGTGSSRGNGYNPTITNPRGVMTGPWGVLQGSAPTLGSTWSYIAQTPASQPASAQTFSVWLKKVTGTYTNIYLMATNDNSTYWSVACTPVSTKWTRYSLTVTGTAANYSFRIGYDLRDAAQTSVLTSTFGYGAWGAQVEAGSVASSTIEPVTSASVTRAADALTIPWSSSVVPMSVYVSAIDNGIGTQADATGLVLASVGNANNRFTLSATSTPDYSLNYRTASTDHKASDTGSIGAFGDRVELRATLATGGAAGLSHAKNGGTETTPATTSATFPGAWDSANIEIGSLAGAQQGGLVLLALVITAGVVTLARSRTASRTPISIGPDTTPYSVLMSPHTLALVTGGADVTVTSVVKNAAGATIVGAVVTYASSNTAVFTVGSGTGIVHAVAAGNATLTASTTVVGVTDTVATAVTVPPPRTLIFPHARFAWQATPPASTTSADKTFGQGHWSDVMNDTAAIYPAALACYRSATLIMPTTDTGSTFTGAAWSSPADDTYSATRLDDFANAYATGHGQTAETYWLHAYSGASNTIAYIAGIDTLGVVTFNSPYGTQITSFPYAAGQSVVLAGLSAGNGTYVIASIQQNGVTLTSWSSGALGSGVLTQSIGALSVTGSGASTLANRNMIWYGANWRNVPAFSVANARSMHAARVAAICVPVSGTAIDGVRFAEMSALTITVAYPSNSVEYFSTGPTQFILDLCTTLTLMLATPGVTVIRANTATSQTATDIQVSKAAKGVQATGLLNIYPGDTGALDYFIARLNDGLDVEFIDTTPWQNGTGANSGLPSGITQGNYPSVTARHQMSSYAYYLLGVDPAKRGSFNSMAALSGESPLSLRWQPGFEYNVGQPTAAYTRGAPTRDGLGNSYSPLTRAFSLDGGSTTSALSVFSAPSHEPPNFVTITDIPNTALATGTGLPGQWTYNGQATLTPPSIISDATFGSVMRLTYGPWTIPAGHSGGPGAHYMALPTVTGATPARAVYLSAWIRMSVGFIINFTNDQKLFQMVSGPGETMCTIIYGQNPTAFHTGYNLCPTSPRPGTPWGQNTSGSEQVPVPATKVQADGQWHFYEALFSIDDPQGTPNGHARIWYDGKLTVALDDELVVASGSRTFYELGFDPLWGGQQGTLATAQYIDVGPIHLSGINTFQLPTAAFP